MANQTHLRWLRDDVEAWNKKREQEDFIPDLSGANLRNFIDASRQTGVTSETRNKVLQFETRSV